jgi:hypothetical protein
MKYKFLDLIDGKLKSNSGDHTWELNRWYTHEGEVKKCEQGFHCSTEPLDAFSFVKGEIIAIVETKGKSDKEKDKEAWEKMKITKAYYWDKEASVKLAIFSAELVIDIYEKQCPNDSGPRKAIEAAKKYLENPTEENKAAANAAANAAAYAANAATKKVNTYMKKLIKELKPYV